MDEGFSDLMSRHALQGDSFYDKSHLGDASKNAALFVGSFIIGIFIMMRIIDTRVQKRVFIPWMQMTVWTHLLVAAMLLTHGLSDTTPAYYPEMVLAICTIAVVVGLARLMWFKFDTSSMFPMFTDVFTHAVVPLIAFLWFLHRRPLGITNTPVAVAMLLGVLGVWISVNVVVRGVRGVWVYGKDASDPYSKSGRVQSFGLLALFCGIFAILALVGR